MAKRYRHYLDKLSRTNGPRIVVCVAVQSTVTEHTTGSPRRTESVHSWHMVILVRRNGQYYRSSYLCGEHPLGFWYELGQLSKDRCRVTVISHNCTRVWSLLQLWEGIEDGRISIQSGKDAEPLSDAMLLHKLRQTAETTRRPESCRKLSGMSERNGPGMCIEDPPNIATLYLLGGQSTLTWYDVRNWGAEPAADTDAAVILSGWLADWYVGIAGLASAAGIGAPSCTAASWALTSFRSKYYDGGIYCHTNEIATKLEAAAYYGGRCECYRIGKVDGLAYMVDVRSCYVSVCRNTMLPVRLLSVGAPSQAATSDGSEWTHNAIAEVLVQTDYPVVPRAEGRDIIYPVGRFWTTLCGQELSLTVRNGSVQKIRTIATYDMDLPLARWADAVDNMRRAAEEISVKGVAAAIKVAGVSLIGKLGQRARGWDRYPGGDGRIQYGEIWGSNTAGSPQRYRYVCGLCWKAVDRGWTAEAVIHIAAWVNSSARCLLWRLMQSAGMDHVYYCDTDALIVDSAGLRALEQRESFSRTRLGSLSVRHGPGECEIWGIKHYRIGDHYVCAGKPKGISTDCGDGWHHWYTLPASVQVQDGNRPTPSAVLLSRPVQTRYRHGTVSRDGLVSPIQLWES